MRELNKNEKDLLERIVSKPQLQLPFFQKAKGLHWFEPLKNMGFFEPNESIKPKVSIYDEKESFSIPPWLPLEFLLNTAKSGEFLENIDFANECITIIQRTTQYAKDEDFGNYHAWYMFAQILSYLPSVVIPVSIIDNIDYWLEDRFDSSLVVDEFKEHWLPNLLKGVEHEKLLAFLLLEKLFDIRIVESTNFQNQRDAQFRYSDYYVKELLVDIPRLSGTVFGVKVVQLYMGKLEFVLNELDKDSYSYSWRRAIEDHEQDRHNDDAESFLVSAIRDSLLGAIEFDNDSVNTYLEKLLSSKYTIHNRIAIYIVNNHFSRFVSRVDDILRDHFFEPNFHHEMWHFLHAHFMNFTEVQQAFIFSSINTKSERPYERMRWLEAIRESSHDAEIQYQGYLKSIDGLVPEHPDFLIWHGPATMVEHKSPLPFKEMQTLPVETIINKILTYEPPETQSFREPGLKGFGEALREVIKTRTNEFMPVLPSLLAADSVFLYNVIEAFRELWNEENELSWDNM